MRRGGRRREGLRFIFAGAAAAAGAKDASPGRRERAGDRVRTGRQEQHKHSRMQHPGPPWPPGVPPVTRQGQPLQHPRRHAELCWLPRPWRAPDPPWQGETHAPSHGRTRASRRAGSSSAGPVAQRGGRQSQQLLQMQRAGALRQLRPNRVHSAGKPADVARWAPCPAGVGVPRPRLRQWLPPLVPAPAAVARPAVRPCRLATRFRPGHRVNRSRPLRLATVLADICGQKPRGQGRREPPDWLQSMQARKYFSFSLAALSKSSQLKRRRPFVTEPGQPSRRPRNHPRH